MRAEEQQRCFEPGLTFLNGRRTGSNCRRGSNDDVGPLAFARGKRSIGDVDVPSPKTCHEPIEIVDDETGLEQTMDGRCSARGWRRTRERLGLRQLHKRHDQPVALEDRHPASTRPVGGHDIA
jgi:hypothetical protein